MVAELLSSDSSIVVASVRIEGIGFFGLLLLVVVVVIASTTWHYSRARDILEHWANRNGYRIVSSEYRNFAKGPFFWTTSKAQAVYYVRVQDQHGKIRSGWVRCGGWWSGLFSDEATVKWDS